MRKPIFLLALAGLAISGPALAQSSPSAFTTGYRYDAEGQLVGTIAPDPDDSGPLAFAAVRNTYDAAGRLTKVETGELAAWQSEAVNPANWGAVTTFTVHRVIDTIYDAMGRKLQEKVSASGTSYRLTQYSYDVLGRLECMAVRMNPAVFASLPASACTLGTQGSYGPDRITRTVYTTEGWPQKIQKAYGTSIQQDYATYSYNANGKPLSMTDANGNRAEMTYDGHDRQKRWIFPSKTAAGAANPADYEEYGYDAASNRTSLRKRDGSTITYQYDALNRNTVKIVPERAGLSSTHTRDVYYGHDLRGLQTYARFDSTSGEGLTTSYDGVGRPASSSLTMDSATRTLSYIYDKNGNRTELNWPDLAKTSYSYDGLDRMLVLYEGALASNVNLVAYGYNNRGLRASQNGRYSQYTTFSYDPVGRLSGLGHDFPGSANDVAYTYGYTPAFQIAQYTRNNDAYRWTEYQPVNRAYTTNGLNQYTAAGPATFNYDANGNLTSEGSTSFVFDIENRLVGASGAKNATLRYDPIGRLYETVGGGATTRFLHDGDELVAEYSGDGTLLRRYAHGKNVDDPVVWYEGSTLAAPHWLHSDYQGSVIAATTSSGVVAINSYDEYGIPATNAVGHNVYGRFGYTGQAWIPELGLWYYKARIYSPTLGRFMQTDPVGYKGGTNLYAYVANDPANLVDPIGTSCVFVQGASVGKPAAAQCSVDDKASFAKAGYSKEDIKRVERTYTREVNRLLKNPFATKRVTVGNKMVTMRAGTIANGLMQSYVRYGRSRGTADTGGGWAQRGSDAGSILGLELGRKNPAGLPFRITLDKEFMDSSEEERAETLVHEGMHTDPAEAAFQGMRGFEKGHQYPYQKASEFFHGLPNE